MAGIGFLLPKKNTACPKVVLLGLRTGSSWPVGWRLFHLQAGCMHALLTSWLRGPQAPCFVRENKGPLNPSKETRKKTKEMETSGKIAGSGGRLC